MKRLWILLIPIVGAVASWRSHSLGLFDDLMYSYDKNVLPNADPSQAVTVKFSSSLIRIIDLNEKLQEMTTSLWLEMTWTDNRLIWNVTRYAGIRKMILAANQLWLPDIILYDNSNGDPHVTILGNAVVHNDGTVVWKPPAIYKSYCNIEIEYFPYDTQNCRMKFGAWSHDGSFLDIIQAGSTGTILYEDGSWVEYQENGMDLTYYERSAEWDLLNLTNTRHVVPYAGCCGEKLFIDIRFQFKLRRKSLFFTVFFVLPCIIIASLTAFAFYLPSCSMKKMTFSITLFMALIVFLIALADLLPPNSVKVPLMAQYLLFTMTMISVSIASNVVILNVHYRTDRMPGLMQRIFLGIIPRFLRVRVPAWHEEPSISRAKQRIRASVALSDRLLGLRDSFTLNDRLLGIDMRSEFNALPLMAHRNGSHLLAIRRMIAHVHYIANHFANMEDVAKGKEDWTYVALIIDRLLLYLFTVANIVGFCIILLQAPTIWTGEDHLPIPLPTRPLGRDTYAQSRFHSDHR